MVQTVPCPRCQTLVPADAPSGECPACLLLLGLAETPDGSRDGTIPFRFANPTVATSGFASADPDATVTVGEPRPGRAGWPTIPGYEIIDELGEGGGGKVYKAEQIKADRRIVAIKVLHGQTRVERERILREARALGRISHPNIVTIYDVDETAEGPYFSMEYMAGGSLSDRIKRNKPSPQESARIVEAVGRGVAAAHTAGILHRDLKPSNILLTADGIAKVSDFGLAKFEDGPADMSTLERVTPTGALLGTPAYMAPEQAAGRTNDVDERTDVYGVGAVLYHCLIGRPPFRGDTNVETAHRVIWDQLQPPRSIDRTIPPSINAICEMCLEKSKANRYATVGQLVDDLDRYLNGVPTVARSPDLAVRFGRRLLRNQLYLWITAGALLIAVVAATLTHFFGPSPVVTTNDAAAAEFERQALRIESELDQNHAVTLIDTTGPPKWWSWVAQTDPNTSPSSIGDVFSIQSWGYGLLELVRDPRHDSYRITAQIMHLESHQIGNVGIYLGRVKSETDSTPIHQLIEVSFNDIILPFIPLKPDGKPFEAPGIDKNPVSITQRGFASRGTDDVPWMPSLVSYSKNICSPSGLTNTGWRTLTVDVTPRMIRVTWDQDANGIVECEFSALTKDSTGAIADAAKLGFVKPWVGALRPGFNARGGVGLFVYRGSAAFKSVVIQPINGE